MLLFFLSSLVSCDLYVKEDCTGFDEYDSSCIEPKDVKPSLNLDDYSGWFGLTINLFVDLTIDQLFTLGYTEDAMITINGKKNQIDEFGYMEEIDFMRMIYIDLNNQDSIWSIEFSYINLKFVGTGDVNFDLETSYNNDYLFVSAEECNKVNFIGNVPDVLTGCQSRNPNDKSDEIINMIILDDCSPYDYSYFSKCYKPSEIKCEMFTGYTTSNLNIFVGSDINPDYPLCLDHKAATVDIYNYNINTAPLSKKLMAYTDTKPIVIIDVDKFTAEFNQMTIHDLDLKFKTNGQSIIPVDVVSLDNVHLDAGECAKNVLNDNAKNYISINGKANTLKCFGIPEYKNFEYNTIVISDNCDELVFDGTISLCYSPEEYDNSVLQRLNNETETVFLDLQANFDKEIDFSQTNFINLSKLDIKHKEVEGYIKVLPTIKLNIDSLENKNYKVDFDFKYVDVELITTQTVAKEWQLGNADLKYSTIRTSTNIKYSTDPSFKLVGNYVSNYKFFEVTVPEKIYSILIISENNCSSYSDDISIDCITPDKIDGFDFSGFDGKDLSIGVDNINEKVLKINSSLEAENIKITGILSSSNDVKPAITINFDDYNISEKATRTLVVQNIKLELDTKTELRKFTLPFDTLTFTDSIINGPKKFKLKEGSTLNSKDPNIIEFFIEYSKIQISDDCSSPPDGVKCLLPSEVSSFDAISFNADVPKIEVELYIGLEDTQVLNLMNFPENQNLIVKSSSDFNKRQFTFLIPTIAFKKLIFTSINLDFNTSNTEIIKAKQMVFHNVILNEQDICNNITLEGLFYSNAGLDSCWPSKFDTVVVSNDCFGEPVNQICISGSDVNKFNIKKLKQGSDSLITILLNVDVSQSQSFDLSKLTLDTSIKISSKDTTVHGIKFGIPSGIKFGDLSFINLKLSFDITSNKIIKCQKISFDNCSVDSQYCYSIYIENTEFSMSNTIIPPDCFTYNPEKSIYSGLLISDQCITDTDDKHVKCITPNETKTFNMGQINPELQIIPIEIRTDLESDELLDFSKIEENKTLLISSMSSQFNFTFGIPSLHFEKIYIKNIYLSFDTVSSSVINAELMKFIDAKMDQSYCTSVTYTGNYYSNNDNCWNYVTSSVIVSNSCIDESVSKDICIEKEEMITFNLSKLTPDQNNQITCKLTNDITYQYAFMFDTMPDCDLSIESTDEKRKKMHFRFPEKTLRDIYFHRVIITFAASYSDAFYCDHVYFIDSEQVKSQCDSFSIISPYLDFVNCSEDSVCEVNCYFNSRYKLIIIKDYCTYSDTTKTVKCLKPDEVSSYDLRKVMPEEPITIELSTNLSNNQLFDYSKAYKPINLIIRSTNDINSFTFSIPENTEFADINIEKIDLHFNFEKSVVLKSDNITFTNVVIDHQYCYPVFIEANNFELGNMIVPDDCFTYDPSKELYSSVLVAETCGDVVSGSRTIKCLTSSDISSFSLNKINEKHGKVEIVLQTKVENTNTFNFAGVHKDFDIYVKSADITPKDFAFQVPSIELSDIYFTLLSVTLVGNNHNLYANQIYYIDSTQETSGCTTYNIISPYKTPSICNGTSTCSETCYNNRYTLIQVKDSCGSEILPHTKCITNTEVTSFDLREVVPGEPLVIEIFVDVTNKFDFSKIWNNQSILIKSSSSAKQSFTFEIPTDKEFNNLFFENINLNIDKTKSTKITANFMKFIEVPYNVDICSITFTGIFYSAEKEYDNCITSSYSKVYVSSDCFSETYDSVCISPDEVDSYDLSKLTKDDQSEISIILNADLQNDQLFNFSLYPKDSALVVKSLNTDLFDFTFLLTNEIVFSDITFTYLNLTLDPTLSESFKCGVITFNYVNVDTKYCYSIFIESTQRINNGSNLPIECFTFDPSHPTFSGIIISTNCQGSNKDKFVKCIGPSDVSSFNLFNKYLSIYTIKLETDLTAEQKLPMGNFQQYSEIFIESDAKRTFYFDIPDNMEYKDIHLTKIKLELSGKKDLYCDHIYYVESEQNVNQCGEFNVVSIYKDSIQCDSSSTCQVDCYYNTRYTTIQVKSECPSSSDSKTTICISPTAVSSYDLRKIMPDEPLNIELYDNIDERQTFDFSKMYHQPSIIISNQNEGEINYKFKIPKNALFGDISITDIALSFDETLSSKLKCNDLNLVNVTLDHMFCYSIYIDAKTITTNLQIDCFTYNPDAQIYSGILVTDNCDGSDNSLKRKCILPQDVTSFDYNLINPLLKRLDITINADLNAKQLFNFDSKQGVDVYIESSESQKRRIFYLLVPNNAMKDIYLSSITLSMSGNNKDLYCDHMYLTNSVISNQFCSEYSIISKYEDSLVCESDSTCPDNCLYNKRYTKINIKSTCYSGSDDIQTKCLTPSDVNSFNVKYLMPNGPLTIELTTHLDSTQYIDFNGINDKRIFVKSSYYSQYKFTFKIPNMDEHQKFSQLVFDNVELSFDTSDSTTLRAGFMKFNSVKMDMTYCSDIEFIGKFYSIEDMPCNWTTHDLNQINVYADCTDYQYEELCIEPNEVSSIKFNYFVTDKSEITINLDCDLTTQAFIFNVDLQSFVIKSTTSNKRSFLLRIPEKNQFNSLTLSNLILEFDTSYNSILSVIETFSVSGVTLKYNSFCTSVTLSQGTQFIYDESIASDCFKNFNHIIVSDSCSGESKDWETCITPDKVGYFNVKKIISGKICRITLEANISDNSLFDTSQMAGNSKFIIESAPETKYKYIFMVPSKDLSFSKIVCKNIVLDFKVGSKSTLSIKFMKFINTDLYNEDICTSLTLIGNFYSVDRDYKDCSWSKKIDTLSIYDNCFDEPLNNVCLEPNEVSSFDSSLFSNNDVTIILDVALKSDQLLVFSNNQPTYIIKSSDSRGSKSTFTLLIQKLNYESFSFVNVDLSFDVSITQLFKVDSLTFSGVSMDDSYCTLVQVDGSFTAYDGVYPNECFLMPSYSMINVSETCLSDRKAFCLRLNDIAEYDFSNVNQNQPLTINLFTNMDDKQLFDFSKLESVNELIIQSSCIGCGNTPLYTFTFQNPDVEFKKLTFNDIILSFSAEPSNITSDVLVLNNVNLDPAFCVSIKLIGELQTNGGNVSDLCFSDLYTIKPIAISNKCDTLTAGEIGFNALECHAVSEVNKLTFGEIEGHLIIVLLENLTSDQYFDLSTLKDKSEVQFIGRTGEQKNLPATLTFDVTEKRYSILSFTNIKLDFKTYGNDLIDCETLMLKDVVMDTEYCKKIFVPSEFEYKGDAAYKDCFGKVQDVITELINKTLILYVGSVSNCPAYEVGIKKECITDGELETYNFTTIEKTIRKIILVAYDAIEHNANFAGLQHDVDLTIQSEKNIGYKNVKIDLLKVGNRINTLELSTLLKVEFDTSSENKLYCHKLIINGVAQLVFTPNRVDITNVKEIDFSEEDLLDKFIRPAKFESIALNDESGQIVVTAEGKVMLDGKVNNIEADSIEVKTLSQNINLKMEGSATNMVVVRPMSNDATLTVDQTAADNNNFKFGMKLIDNLVANLEYPKNIIPLSLSGNGKLNIKVPKNTQSIGITNEVKTDKMEIIVPASVKEVAVGSITMVGNNPSFKLVNSANSKSLKETVTLKINDLKLEDFQKATIDSVKIVQSLNIGLLSLLTCESITFDDASIINIGYYKGPLLEQSIIGNLINPKVVKLVKNNALDDTENWPFTIKLFKTTSDNIIELSDAEKLYEKKYIDGYLAASLKRSPEESQTEITSKKNEFPVGGIIGIVVGVVVVIVIIIVVVVLVSKKNKEFESSDLDRNSDEEEMSSQDEKNSEEEEEDVDYESGDQSGK